MSMTETEQPETTSTSANQKRERRSERRKVTAREVQRFYALCCDVGLDNFIETMMTLRREAMRRNGAKPVTAKEQSGAEAPDVTFDRDAMIEIESSIDIPKMIRVFGTSDRFFDLVSIVCGVPIDEAEEIDMDTFTEEFSVFTIACARPISMLLGFTRSI